MVDSKLDREAKQDGWLKCFDMFDWVGGRTSITSAVGLLPGALIGADIRDPLWGKRISQGIPLILTGSVAG